MVGNGGGVRVRVYRGRQVTVVIKGQEGSLWTELFYEVGMGGSWEDLGDTGGVDTDGGNTRAKW